jgi:hypothetical protein
LVPFSVTTNRLVQWRCGVSTVRCTLLVPCSHPSRFVGPSPCPYSMSSAALTACICCPSVGRAPQAGRWAEAFRRLHSSAFQCERVVGDARAAGLG